MILLKKENKNDMKTIEGQNAQIEGANITDFELKGNTYQNSYKGINLLKNFKKVTNTQQGITFTYNEKDGTYLINGKNNGARNSACSLVSSENDFMLPIGDLYTVPITENGVTLTIYVIYEDDTSQYIDFNKDKSHITISKEIKKVNSLYIQVRQNTETTFNNYKFYPIIATTPITADDYEPYTNGAGCSPDFPVPIQTATGLQNVNVCGKNLCDISQGFRKGYLNTNTGVFNSQNQSFVLNQYVQVIGGETYSYSLNENVTNMCIYSFNENKEYIKREKIVYSEKNTFVALDNNAKYIVLGGNYNNSTTITQEILNNLNIQLEKGSTATSYEPYKGNTYEVNLGKNLFDIDYMIESQYNASGNSTTGYNKTNNDITSVGNYTSSGRRFLNHIILSKGTYTLSFNQTFSGTQKDLMYSVRNFTTLTDIVNATSLTSLKDNARVSFSFTLNEETDIFISIQPANSNGGTLTLSNIQLEKGQATSYSPYFTPIELNKIGDYEDSIKKSTGKNLISSISKTGNSIFFNGASTPNEYVFKAGTYTFNYVDNTARSTYINYSDGRQTSLGSDKPITFTSNLDFNLRIYGSGITLEEVSNVQLELGSQATTYEPYGKVWYVAKNIKKFETDNPNIYLIDGSDGNAQSSSNGLFQIFTSDLFTDFINEEMLSSKFTYHYDSRINGNINANTYLTDNTFCVRQGTNDRIYFKSSFLANKSRDEVLSILNGLDLVYVSTNLSVIEITNQELINVLNEIEKAKLLHGENNIMITASDLVGTFKISYDDWYKFEKILRSGYNIKEGYDRITQKFINGRRKQILSDYEDCIIQLSLGTFDLETTVEYLKMLEEDGEYEYYSFNDHDYKRADFLLEERPEIIVANSLKEDEAEIEDFEVTLLKAGE